MTYKNIAPTQSNRTRPIYFWTTSDANIKQMTKRAIDKKMNRTTRDAISDLTKRAKNPTQKRKGTKKN